MAKARPHEGTWRRSSSLPLKDKTVPPNKCMKLTVRGGSCYDVGAGASVAAAPVVAAAARSLCTSR